MTFNLKEKKGKIDNNLLSDKKFVNAFFSFVGLSYKFKVDMATSSLRMAGTEHKSHLTGHCFANTESILSICEGLP